MNKTLIENKNNIQLENLIEKFKNGNNSFYVDMQKKGILPIQQFIDFKNSESTKLIEIFLGEYIHIEGGIVVNYSKNYYDSIGHVGVRIEKTLIDTYKFKETDLVIFKRVFNDYIDRDIYGIVKRMKELFNNTEIMEILNNFSSIGIKKYCGEKKCITQFDLFLCLEESKVNVYEKWKFGKTTKRKYISNFVTGIYENAKKTTYRTILPKKDCNGNYIFTNKRIIDKCF